MRIKSAWTNPSVRALAGARDPVVVITERAREAVLKALDKGWVGPPYDPIRLAEILGVDVRPKGDVRDARLIDEGGRPVIEYNPGRPRARVRYSVAHECAHALFPDWAERVRNRQSRDEIVGDEWELESLCNVGAAELLMPYGTMQSAVGGECDVDELLRARESFDVSVEALMLRAVGLSDEPCAMIASRACDDGLLVEYSAQSSDWIAPIRKGDRIPTRSVLSACNGIGHTVKAEENWGERGGALRVEGVGVPGFPGSSRPRVIGWLRPSDSLGVTTRSISYVIGDATLPASTGPCVIVQVVNDKAKVWGGGGFAAALRRRYPAAQEDFASWFVHEGRRRGVGGTRLFAASAVLTIASIVAQHGFGPSDEPRIRYGALHEGLRIVAQEAAERAAGLHMPRIGAGQAGGRWPVIEELIRSAVHEFGVAVTVYDPPSRERTLGVN